MTTARVHVPGDVLRRQVLAVVTSWGVAGDLAPACADALTYASLSGIDSHGIAMLVSYDRLVTSGGVDAGARPHVVHDSAATALVDGAGGFGHPCGALGMRLAVDKARELGVGVVAARGSRHLGAAGYYAALAAERGMVGLVTTSSRLACVPPTHGAVPRLGTNPVAFAAPAGSNPPVVLDMSTSTVAYNKVRSYERLGRRLPTGWVVDADGRPVTDPATARAQVDGGAAGGITPLGGTAETSSHKGYGLAVMVQVLSAVLGGSALGPRWHGGDRPTAPDPEVGHLFLALDPAAFRPPEEFAADLDATVDALRATPPIDPARPVLVPGDPEATCRRERERTGVPVPEGLLRELDQLCTRAGAPFLLGSA